MLNDIFIYIYKVSKVSKVGKISKVNLREVRLVKCTKITFKRKLLIEFLSMHKSIKADEKKNYNQEENKSKRTN